MTKGYYAIDFDDYNHLYTLLHRFESNDVQSLHKKRATIKVSLKSKWKFVTLILNRLALMLAGYFLVSLLQSNKIHI